MTRQSGKNCVWQPYETVTVAVFMSKTVFKTSTIVIVNLYFSEIAKDLDTETI